MLDAGPKAKGGRPSKTGAEKEPVSTLADLGVDKKQSAAWQKLAAAATGARLQHHASEAPLMSMAIRLGRNR
jgi:hypothetical protein